VCAGGNYTLRVEITLLRVEIARFEIILVRFVIADLFFFFSFLPLPYYFANIIYWNHTYRICVMRTSLMAFLYYEKSKACKSSVDSHLKFIQDF
jgi:hypothetical protein